MLTRFVKLKKKKLENCFFGFCIVCSYYKFIVNVLCFTGWYILMIRQQKKKKRKIEFQPTKRAIFKVKSFPIFRIISIVNCGDRFWYVYIVENVATFLSISFRAFLWSNVYGWNVFLVRPEDLNFFTQHFLFYENNGNYRRKSSVFSHI